MYINNGLLVFFNFDIIHKHLFHSELDTQIDAESLLVGSQNSLYKLKLN